MVVLKDAFLDYSQHAGSATPLKLPVSTPLLTFGALIHGEPKVLVVFTGILWEKINWAAALPLEKIPIPRSSPQMEMEFTTQRGARDETEHILI